MGKSADFSSGINIIRKAHGDAIAILEKWRELIEAPGEVVLNVKEPNGTITEVRLPSIRAAINQYLGGVFSQITLSKDDHKIILRVTDNGDVEMVNPDESHANLIIENLVATRISGVGSTLPIVGDVDIQGGVIQNADIQILNASGGEIRGAVFNGATAISGTTTISGDLIVNRISANTLSAEKAVYRKQVVRFGIEGLCTSALNGPTNGDIWTGDPAILEAAGIYPEPRWSDCTYMPEPLTNSAGTIHIYWGDASNTPIMLYGPTGGTDFSAPFMVAWPYKMYEAVDGGYRIRWLPLNDAIGRIHYGRVGKGGNAVEVTCVDEISTATGNEARVVTMYSLQRYSCVRFMAGIETEADAGATTTHNLMYRT